MSIKLFLFSMFRLFFFLYQFPHLKSVGMGESVVFILLRTPTFKEIYMYIVNTPSQ